LAAAGWKKNAEGLLEKDGKIFEFTIVTNNANPQRKAIMSIAQEAWAKLGIRCRTQAFEWTVFLEDFVHPHNFDALVLGWVGGDSNPDKYQLWHSSQIDKYQLNHVGYQSAEADELILRIREEYDPDEQIRLARKLHNVIARDQPYTFMYEPLVPNVLDKRLAIIDRTPDGREVVRPIKTLPSGEIAYYFDKWRKLPDAPVFAE
jgi:ABC-type transport system substrate-binding protein